MAAEIARVFVGFDSKEVVAYHVLAQSIIEHASMPVMFCPIVLPHLEGTFTRERNALQSTEFSFSRFLVPYLSHYEGWSLFMDCDMLVFHARDYEKITGDPLFDPNRHTRVQPIRYDAAGVPQFDPPVANGPLA